MPPHELERGQALSRSPFRKAGHAVFEDPPIVLLDGDLLSGPVWRLEVFANPQLTCRIDAPGQLDPEFILFPDLSRICLVAEFDLFTRALAQHPPDGLPEGYPLARMRLLTHQIVPLRPHPHRKDVVGEPGRLTPHRSK